MTRLRGMCRFGHWGWPQDGWHCAERVVHVRPGCCLCGASAIGVEGDRAFPVLLPLCPAPSSIPPSPQPTPLPYITVHVLHRCCSYSTLSLLCRHRFQFPQEETPKAKKRGTKRATPASKGKGGRKKQAQEEEEDEHEEEEEVGRGVCVSYGAWCAALEPGSIVATDQPRAGEQAGSLICTHSTRLRPGSSRDKHGQRGQCACMVALKSSVGAALLISTEQQTRQQQRRHRAGLAGVWTTEPTLPPLASKFSWVLILMYHRVFCTLPTHHAAA